MGNVSKELLREYIKNQHVTNANEVLAGLKEMFKDVLQEALEAEVDEALGYCKYDATTKNNDMVLVQKCRHGHVVFLSDIIKEIKEVSTDGKESKKLYRRI